MIFLPGGRPYLRTTSCLADPLPPVTSTLPSALVSAPILPSVGGSAGPFTAGGFIDLHHCLHGVRHLP